MITICEVKKIKPGLYKSDDGRQIKIRLHATCYEISNDKNMYNTESLPEYYSDEDLDRIFNEMWKNLEGE